MKQSNNDSFYGSQKTDNKVKIPIFIHRKRSAVMLTPRNASLGSNLSHSKRKQAHANA